MNQHYCKQYGCLATYPCSIHPDEELEQIQEYFAEDVRQEKVVHLPPRIVHVVFLPCHHNYPVPLIDGKKLKSKFTATCQYCENTYSIEMVNGVYEMMRVMS